MKYGTVLRLRPIGIATAASPIRVMFLRWLTVKENMRLVEGGRYFKGILVHGNSTFAPGGIYDFGANVYVEAED